MGSIALVSWRTTRAHCLDRLQTAHAAVGGSRWVTEELNHSMVLRLASEFQGFARDLHNEATKAVAHSLAGGDPARLPLVLDLFVMHRRLDRGNATPAGLNDDFSMFQLRLWAALERRHPTKDPQWRMKLERLNDARNSLAHDDQERLQRVVAAGWPPTLRSVRRWRTALDALATAMDDVIGSHLRQSYGITPW